VALGLLTDMKKLRLISSDSHVVEPADLWQERIDSSYRNRAPRVVHLENRDQWYAENDVPIGIFGTTGQAGVRFESPEKLSFDGRETDIPLGGRDPEAHVRDLDTDTVSAAVLYPSVALTAYMIPATDLLSAIFRSYNDWLSDFCQSYPHRLKGIGMLNVDDVGEAVGELKRIARLGLVGAVIPQDPGERRYSHPSYERLWAAAQNLATPLSLHQFSTRWIAGKPPGLLVRDKEADPAGSVNKEVTPRNALTDMIFSGVFERYPGLKVGAVEFELAWAPFFMDRMDAVYEGSVAGFRKRFAGGALPSDFFRKNVFLSFQEDDLGIKLRSYMGNDSLMWASDYPHAEGTFPKSREIVNRILTDVEQDERTRIAGGNVAKLYGFPLG